MRPLIAVLTTLFMLSAGAALAQPEAAADPNNPVAEPAAAEAAAAAEADDALTEPVLEDYEASEQISEDLSVAFPVDI